MKKKTCINSEHHRIKFTNKEKINFFKIFKNVNIFQTK